MASDSSYDLKRGQVPGGRGEIFAKLRRARQATQEALHRTSTREEKLEAVRKSREKLRQLGWLKERES